MMRALLIPFALLLSACGFTPMHGTSGVAAPLANVDVELTRGPSVVDNQAGFFVMQRLRDRIGKPASDVAYTLNITPNYRRSRLGLTDADVASRYDVTVRADWALVENKTGKTIKTGRSSSKVAFGAPEGPYGVITADNVGVEQTSKETADKLVIELARYFASVDKK